MEDRASPAALRLLREVSPNSFIFEQQGALPPKLCDQVIRRFEQAVDEQYPGRVGQQGEHHEQIKKSTDLFISGKEHWHDVDRALFQSLSAALLDLRRAFPYFRGRFKDEGYGIQRTQAEEYYRWHIDGGSHQFSQRQLVAIWYLNHVEGPGGATEFLRQNVKIRPQCGKLILFPPFWTHEHRGEKPGRGVKYIATTWLVFA